MIIAIEDLEALKELNDELEESHNETEKQMQDEIGSALHVPGEGEEKLTPRALRRFEGPAAP